MVGSASAIFTFYNPSYAWSGGIGEGYVYLNEPISYHSWSMSGTGGIVDFWLFTMNSTTYPRLGLTTDTAGHSMTLTHLSPTLLRYNQSGVSHQRIWCPDLGEPANVTGATWGWDGVWSVVNLDTAGASVVTVQWDAPIIPIPTPVDDDSLLLLFAVIGGVLVAYALSLRD